MLSLSCSITAQMESGFIAVKSMLGGDTLITDAEIRDALWNFYFDVEQSTDYLLGWFLFASVILQSLSVG